MNQSKVNYSAIENQPARSRDFSRELAGQIFLQKSVEMLIFLDFLLYIWYNKCGDKRCLLQSIQALHMVAGTSIPFSTIWYGVRSTESRFLLGISEPSSDGRFNWS